MRRLIDMSFEIPCKARLNLGLFCLGRQMQKPAELISVSEKRSNHLSRTRSMSSDQKIRSLRSNFLTPKHRHRGSKCKKKGDAKALLKITQLKQKPTLSLLCWPPHLLGYVQTIVNASCGIARFKLSTWNSISTYHNGIYESYEKTQKKILNMEWSWIELHTC